MKLIKARTQIRTDYVLDINQTQNQICTEFTALVMKYKY